LPETLTEAFGIFLIAFVGGLAGATAKHVLFAIAKRAEKKAAIQQSLGEIVLETLNEIRDLSVEYWQADECQELRPKAARVVALCDGLPDLYVALFEDETTTRMLDVKLNRLSNVITGGSFQQSSRKADHTVLSEMETELQNLVVFFRIEHSKLKYPWH